MKKTIPILEYRDYINGVSPSFCAAKWQQVTLHLQTGHTHSCHHPRTHKIPLDELAANPSALHNTSFKKLQREKMLNGVRPEECDYCWRVEDSGPDAISDRIYKSKDAWARPFVEGIRNMPWDANVVPTYLEVSFSSVCNFKCSYCSPQFSSKWMEEVESHGPYPTSNQFGNIQWLKQTDAMPIPHKDENPYVDAFWKWWPEIHDKLIHFRITGGEPLLAKDTFKILDWYIDNPNPGLELSVNSNMCPPTAILDKFIEKLRIICNEKKVKKVRIFTSAEATGRQAEYIRNGMDYNQWLLNIRRVLDEVPGVTFTVMSTYNLLSVFSYVDFLKDIHRIKQDYGKHTDDTSPIILDAPYLRYPGHQSIFIMPEKWLSKIYDQVTFIHSHVENSNWMGTANRGFYQWEADKFKRIYELVMHQKDPPVVTQEQKDFVQFVDEHDRRRGTNFLDTFPEFEDTYRKWKNG